MGPKSQSAPPRAPASLRAITFVPSESRMAFCLDPSCSQLRGQSGQPLSHLMAMVGSTLIMAYHVCEYRSYYVYPRGPYISMLYPQSTTWRRRREVLSQNRTTLTWQMGKNNICLVDSHQLRGFTPPRP